MMESTETLSVCHFCDKKFSTCSNMYRHIRSVHKVDISFPIQSSIFCAMCPEKDVFKCQNMKTLRDHLEEVHDVKCCKEIHTFKSTGEFTEWKLQTEKEANMQFVRKNGSKKKCDSEYVVYYCSRSGHYTPKGHGQRSIKAQGSKKMDGFCPSQIFMKRTGDTVKVEYYSTHVGHKLELGHLTLPKKDREWIETQISKGVGTKFILNSIRNEICGKVERLHLLTRQDIANLSNKQPKVNVNGVRHNDEKISVESWIQEMEADPLDNPILLYKPQGVILADYPELKKEDFFLAVMNSSQTEMLQQYGNDCIAVDSTHGLNSHQFDLTTVLILDDLRCGFPAAFAFSNRLDEAAMTVFFRVIFAKAGTINTSVFMSDDVDTYYNAWTKTMGNVTTRLLCSWHIDQAWRRNLSKIKGTEKQSCVYKVLHVLMTETDLTAFSKMLPEAMKQLQNDPDTAEFSTYFKTHYESRPQLWAHCFRTGRKLNTNMHLESMHKTIKYIYLAGKTVKRLDKAIHAIMTFLRDKEVERVITLCKGKVSKKISVLRSRHKSSQELSPELIVKSGEDTYLIQSSTNFGETYEVKLIENSCQCKLVCDPCKSCIHKYSCTCYDNSIQWNMCKHIHLVCHLVNSTTGNVQAQEDIDNNESNGENLIIDDDWLKGKREKEMEVHIMQLSNGYGKQRTNIEDYKANLIKDLETSILKIKEIKNVESLKMIEKLVKPFKSSLEVIVKDEIEPTILMPTNLNIHSELVKVSSNKKIEKQGFHSTKRKPGRKENTLMKPSVDERQNISLSLLMGK